MALAASAYMDCNTLASRAATAKAISGYGRVPLLATKGAYSLIAPPCCYWAGFDHDPSVPLPQEGSVSPLGEGRQSLQSFSRYH